MKISIITATYNRADTIRDTIESILSQSHEDWEHIIIDGRSNDNTLMIIAEYYYRYKGRLKLVSEKDRGIYDAMNKGISLATGDVIGFLNSDDVYYNSEVLSSIVKAFNDHPTDGVYGGSVATSYNNLNDIIRIKRGSPYPKGGFSSGWHPSHPTLYITCDIYEKYGYFDLDFGTACDMELMIRFIEKNRISLSYIPLILVKMRFGGASNNSIRAILKANEQVLRAFKKNNLPKPKFYLIKKLVPKILDTIKTSLGIIKMPDTK